MSDRFHHPSRRQLHEAGWPYSRVSGVSRSTQTADDSLADSDSEEFYDTTQYASQPSGSQRGTDRHGRERSRATRRKPSPAGPASPVYEIIDDDDTAVIHQHRIERDEETQLGEFREQVLRDLAAQPIQAQQPQSISSRTYQVAEAGRPTARWTPGETDALVRLLETIGPAWSAMRNENLRQYEKHGPAESIHPARKGTQYREKARSMKMMFLINRQPIPRGFDEFELGDHELMKVAQRQVSLGQQSTQRRETTRRPALDQPEPAPRGSRAYERNLVPPTPRRSRAYERNWLPPTPPTPRQSRAYEKNLVPPTPRKSRAYERNLVPPTPPTPKQSRAYERNSTPTPSQSRAYTEPPGGSTWA